MATFVTVQKIADRCTRLSGQVPGSAVQQYAQDIWLDMINTAVRFVARRYWWPHLMDTITTATDGSTGVLTADLSKVLDYTDIRSIYANNSCVQLPLVSDMVNQSQLGSGNPAGFQALPYTSSQYKNKLIRLLPVDAQCPVVLRVRYVPGDLQLTDMLPFDQDLIVYAVLWAYFVDEGDNAAQADKYMNLFNTKFTDLVSAFANHGTAVEDPCFGMDQWITGSGTYAGPSDLTGEF